MKISNIISDEPVFNKEEVKERLLRENNFLIKLIDTIPAKMYFDSDIQEKITTEKHLLMDKAAEALKRNSSHFELSAKGKHKRARLDPFSQKSVSQIHDELNKKKRKKKKMKTGMHDPSVSLTRAANIEELQRRLHERIKLLQAKRKATQHDPEEQRKQKNKLKKLKKQKGNLLKTEAEKEPEIKKVEKTPKKTKDDKSNAKPVFNKDGNFLYSKFDFSEDGQGEHKKNEYSGKKTKVLLKEAEKKKEKIEKLKEADPEKAELLAKKEKWKKAIQKSEGLKVKDDPKLLKKSLKRQEKKKKKSAKQWKNRTEEVEKKKQVRQDRRNQKITAEKHLLMDKAAEALKRNSSHFELSPKGKHKRACLDPFNQKSVSQIHDELNKKKRKKKKMKTDGHDPSVALSRAANIEELQRRLHECIKLLQTKMHGKGTDNLTQLIETEF